MRDSFLRLSPRGRKNLRNAISSKIATSTSRPICPLAFKRGFNNLKLWSIHETHYPPSFNFCHFLAVDRNRRCCPADPPFEFGGVLDAGADFNCNRNAMIEQGLLKAEDLKTNRISAPLPSDKVLLSGLSENGK